MNVTRTGSNNPRHASRHERRSFARTAGNTQALNSANISGPLMRGGIRL